MHFTSASDSLSPHTWSLLMGCVFILFISAASLSAADLDDEGRQNLAQAQSLLKHLESNLKPAQDAAGPGDAPITGAKAKLTAIRLGQAKAAVAPLAQVLKKLPAEHEEVAAIQKRHDAAVIAIDNLQARIDGKKPTGTPAEVDKSKTMKLDYKQEESFKNAKFTLREIEGQQAALEKIVEQLKDVKDVTTIDHRIIAQTINSIAFVRQRGTYFDNHMAKLPENGAGVAEIAQTYKAAIASVDAAEKILVPIHKQLTVLINPATYPNLNADVKMLVELSSSYGRMEVFVDDRAKAALLVQQLGTARSELARIAKAYDALMRQKTVEGEGIKNQGLHLNDKLNAFVQQAKDQKPVLEKAIAEHLDEMGKLAATAVSEKNPSYFNGGIPQINEWVTEKLALLSVIDPESAKSLTGRTETLRSDLKQKQESLRATIIATNTLPPDRYEGEDKARLTEEAIATWKKEQPDAVVLAVRFPAKDWTRQTLIRYQNKSWYPIDSSRIQAQLIVKHDGELAIIRPVNLWVDHLQKNALSAGAMDGIKDELPPQRYLPLSKVK